MKKLKQFTCVHCAYVIAYDRQRKMWYRTEPHPSGIEHGCPYDYNNPETNRILSEERGYSASIGGTFLCPICGVAPPHEHTSEEIATYRVSRKSNIPEAHK